MSSKGLNAYWREIVSIIEGGLKPDPHRVSSFAEHLARRLEDDGETRLAQRIHRLIDGASKPAGSTFVGQGLPADVESHQVLVEQYVSKSSPHYPVLSKPLSLELRRFVELNRRAGELAAAGLDPPSSLLLFGPPGCGKTMAAIAIADELGLPLILVRLDTLLGSFLGNSAKNLRRVFDNALTRPCVLFLDEFDVIGKMRDDDHEVGEVKRLVGSLLQNMDRVQGRQIIVAATNHEHMLDTAIWRRFDVVLHIQKPDTTEIAGIISELLPADRLSKSETEAIATISHGFSGSDITRIIRRSLQNEFLYPGEPLRKLITLDVLAQIKSYDEVPHYAMNTKTLVLAIYQEFGDGLTIRRIARLAGCSHAYAHETIRAWEKDRGNGR